MVIRDSLMKKISALEEGVVITASDFDIPSEYRGALIKALNQLENAGILKKISKGRYYKPRQSTLGEIPPAESEVVKDFLVREGRIIGYITGTRAFASLGLTTQISSDILVGSNVSRRPLTRRGCKVSFLLQPNPITKRDIPYFILLDVLRLIKRIPATTPDEIAPLLVSKLKTYNASELMRLTRLSFSYPPYVRALLGALLESLNQPVSSLRASLNPITRYQLGVNPDALPTAPNWNIL